MACVTMLAPSLAMATTQLVREAVREVSPVHSETNTERHSPRLNWVVVTGRMAIFFVPTGPLKIFAVCNDPLILCP
jgi:hypothetical protein